MCIWLACVADFDYRKKELNLILIIRHGKGLLSARGGTIKRSPGTLEARVVQAFGGPIVRGRSLNIRVENLTNCSVAEPPVIFLI